MQPPAASTLVALAFCAGGALATGTVQVTTLAKNGTEMEGSAAVAANGTLTPFGDIGVGCGINWKDDTDFGGGLQAGSSTLGLGLGGGWDIGPHNMTAGFGLGLPNNMNAKVSIALDYKGAVEFELAFSSQLYCYPTQNRDGNYVMLCKNQKGE